MSSYVTLHMQRAYHSAPLGELASTISFIAQVFTRVNILVDLCTTYFETMIKDCGIEIRRTLIGKYYVYYSLFVDVEKNILSE